MPPRPAEPADVAPEVALDAGMRAAPATSYRALLAVPFLGRALAGMQLVRVCQSMIGVALVLFSLTRYGSPALAGLVTFASLAPGLLISPIGGAPLGPHGRARPLPPDPVVARLSL